MEKISIKNSAINIFRTTSRINQQESKHSNPFGLSFKGNVLQADVFSSSKRKSSDENIMGKISEKTKAFKSTIVGGINNFNNKLNTRFNNGVNKIVSFGKKIGHDTKELWRKANETSFVWDFEGLSNSIMSFGKNRINSKYSVSELVKRPVSELEIMFKEELAVKG